MTGFALFVMISWLIISIALFFLVSPQSAVLIAIFSGSLFLPIAEVDFPGLPEFNKTSIMAIGLIVGQLFSDSKKGYYFQLKGYDYPMIIWCFISPLASSISNNLGIYNGVSGILENYLNWGVFYWVGRRYFNKIDYIRKLSWSFVIGGLLYLPLILFELRMSPRLHRIIYGYFAHSWRQHLRYGGYRPIVFMEHGLMVALFMVASSIIVYWFWKGKIVSQIRNVQISFVAIALIITTVFCKTAAGWFFLVVGISVFFFYKKNDSTFLIKLLIMFIPIYIIVRISNLITSEMVQSIVSLIFDDERVGSLAVRLLQEDQFSIRALNHPLLGWGRMSRAWPIDPLTGRQLVRMIDATWIIIFAKYGLLGLTSMFSAIGIGPWCVLRINDSLKNNKTINTNNFDIDGIVLSLIVVFFMLDSLVNGMVNPIYILCAGVLVSYYLERKKEYTLFENYQ